MTKDEQLQFAEIDRRLREAEKRIAALEEAAREAHEALLYLYRIHAHRSGTAEEYRQAWAIYESTLERLAEVLERK